MLAFITLLKHILQWYWPYQRFTIKKVFIIKVYLIWKLKTSLSIK